MFWQPSPITIKKEGGKGIIMCTDNVNAFPSKPIGKINITSHSNDSFILNESFKALRSNLLFCGEDIKTIVVTSSIEGEGKSTVSTELAINLSQIKKKTLLIYADMRKPNRICIKEHLPGLSDLLSKSREVDELIFRTQSQYLDVIFSGKCPENPVELLTGETLGEFLNEIKDKYDYIIIDSPPLIPVIDAALISVHCDGAVFVIASEKTSLQEASIAKEKLEKSDCKILGAVLNQVHDSPSHKHYGKKYGYYAGSYSK